MQPVFPTAPRLLKRAVRGALRRLPAKGALTRAAAIAPPLLKPPLVCRVLSRIIELSDLAQLGTISTNLGISRRRLRIAANAPPCYFFGTPESYAGELGPLLLSLHLSRTCDAFVDIGANHGYFAFFVYNGLTRRIPIHYIEPQPELFREIQTNVRRHSLANVHGHQLAIGLHSGPAVFYTNVSHPATSSLRRDFFTAADLREDRVIVSTFDEFAAAHHLHKACVKVDIENAEFEFLKGTHLSRDRILFLIMEVLGPAIEAGFIRAAQRQLGMRAYYINNLRLEHSDEGSFVYRSPQFNWLFCRQSPAELRRVLAGSRLLVA